MLSNSGQSLEWNIDTRLEFKTHTGCMLSGFYEEANLTRTDFFGAYRESLQIIPICNRVDETLN